MFSISKLSITPLLLLELSGLYSALFNLSLAFSLYFTGSSSSFGKIFKPSIGNFPLRKKERKMQELEINRLKKIKRQKRLLLLYK